MNGFAMPVKVCDLDPTTVVDSRFSNDDPDSGFGVVCECLDEMDAAEVAKRLNAEARLRQLLCDLLTEKDDVATTDFWSAVNRAESYLAGEGR